MQTSDRALLYLTLSRAFLAPRGDAFAQALTECLADDLDELDRRLQLGIARQVQALRRELARAGDPLALLQVYSGVFLVPPVCARINVGQYLDGALNGGSVRQMEQAYALCGLARHDAFHDLADHVSVVLEFVAVLYGRQADGIETAVDAGEFLFRLVAPWTARFGADVASAAQDVGLPANPYAPLAAIVDMCVRQHATEPSVDAKAERHQRALQRARARYATRGINADDLAIMQRKLQARGLSADHLAQRAAHLGATS